MVIDFETQSPVNLKTSGVDVYAEHPRTCALCLTYKYEPGGNAAGLWEPSLDFPRHVIEHVEAHRPVAASNSRFDFTIWNQVLCRDFPHIPKLVVGQVTDIAALARAQGLPPSVEKLGEVLCLPIKKDMEGRKAMLALMKPRKARKGEDKNVWHWNDDPALYATLYNYGLNDAETEALAFSQLPPLIDAEREFWEIDQHINNRGVCIDIEAARIASEVIRREQDRIAAEVLELTGQHCKPSQRDKLMGWLAREGETPKSLAKADLVALKEATSSDLVKRVISLRQEHSQESTKKLLAMVRATCGDGRARGLFTYHGASTGRDTSQLVQFQNLKRPGEGWGMEDAVSTITYLKTLSEPEHVLRAWYGSAIDAIANSLRAFIRAAPGHRLLSSDFANIEGRVLAWLAGEAWKLDAFRDYDAGTGADTYKLAYSRAFGCLIEDVTKALRQIGKVMELALGYQGGHNAFITMGKNYAVTPSSLIDPVFKAADPETWHKFAEMAEAKSKSARLGLDFDEWTALKIIVMNWRDAHPAIRTFWKTLEAAATDAVINPGMVTQAGPYIRFKMTGDFLKCRLPSGRQMSYAQPEMRQTWTFDYREKVTELKDFIKELEDAVIRDDAAINEAGAELETLLKEPETETRLTYATQKKGAWIRRPAYGGLLAENCLAGDTLVLTDNGWTRLDSVSKSDLVFDGVEFVEHSGVISKGTEETVDVSGVRSTNDHLILTAEGWKRAEICDGHFRADFWIPNREGSRRLHRGAGGLDSYLRLRNAETVESFRIETYAGSRVSFVRLQESGYAVQKTNDARHVEASGLCGMAFDDRPLPSADASSVEKLRRSRNYGLSGMARRFLGFLAGHGSDVSGGANPRSAGQLARLLRQQLPVDNVPDASEKQTRQSAYSDAARANDGSGSVGNVRYKSNDAALSRSGGRAVFKVTRYPGRTEQVYDIVNCGKRSRFVVLGTDGPFIVHNCTQAAARDILRDAIVRCEKAGLPVVMRVHDEIVAEVPDGKGSLEELTHIMCDSAPWANGLPVAAESSEALRYWK